MKIMSVSLLSAAVLAMPLVVRAEGDVSIADADVQRLLGPTLRSVQVEASSGGGFVSLNLPTGQTLRQGFALPRFTIPVDVLPDIECDIQPMRNTGAPTLNYRDGWFQFVLTMQPVSGNIIARTNSFYPNVTAPRIDVSMRFRLEERGGGLVVSEFQTTTTGAIDLTGAGRPFSPLVRTRIQQAISQNVEAQLRPRLNLLVALVLPGYIRTVTGYGDTLRIGPVRHERDRVLVSVTGRVQRPPIAIPSTTDYTTLDGGMLTRLLKESNSAVSEASKKIKDAEQAQAEADRKLSEKYGAAKSAGGGGGAGKSDKG